MKVTVEINRPSWMTRARVRRAPPLLLVLALVLAGPALASDRFSDVPDANDHHANITAIAEAGITLGCNAEGTLYCPDTVVTRDQMASFIARTAGLGANSPVADADKLDGLDSTDFYADGSKVDDSDLLDGLDSTALQLRVTGTCAAGSAVRVVNAAGTVVCEPDDVDGGNADRLDGLDSTALQLRVTGTCPVGSAVRVVTVSGTVVCEPDDIDGGNAATVDGRSASDLVRAARMQTGATTALATTEVTHGPALSITAPSAGFVVVNSSVTIQNVGCASGCIVVGRVRHINSGFHSLPTEEDLIGRARAAMSTSTVFSVAAGVNTFDIRLRRLSGTGTLNGWFAEMNAIFVPFGSTGGSTP